MKKETNLVSEIYRNRRLVFSLAKNDFKTKYAGSYFGTIWAFVQPIVTICVYWFVFGLALRNGSDKGVPFVLWLIAGLIPWFFLQEGLLGGTNALLEYNYLVKKVVFNIRILPVVKVFSAVFVHCFFVVILLLIYTFMGYPPSLYALQLIYYSICIFVLILAVTYMTSAAVVFFRDLSQIINIMLQVGVWVTPIMWDFNDLHLNGASPYHPETEPDLLYCPGIQRFSDHQSRDLAASCPDFILLGVYHRTIYFWNKTV